MEGLARYALIACVIAAALGGLVTCVLIFRFGLGLPVGDEPPQEVYRRVIATHFGHTFSAVAFALTAMLAALALAVDSPSHRADAERRDVGAIAQRLDAVEDVVERMADTLEQAMDRFERLDRLRAQR